MSYFSDSYGKLAFPIAAQDSPGLYNAQVGAIHAVAAHFTLEQRPGVVTMPTGSGKTAVLMIVPFLLRSDRVLVITPSQFVRWQIAEDFAALGTLKAAGVLPANHAGPKLKELKMRVTSIEAWEALRDYDVVVSTPNCTSPGYSQIPPPPEGLFDLVLIDEAHHSPSDTWSDLIDAFPGVRRVLFTATPFRRDRGQIPGRFVYTYPVARAYEDGIFGQIEYVPVEPHLAPAANDIAVAKKTGEIFNADRKAGFEHFVMVRTDRLSRADALADIYREHTDLRLEIVHSSVSNTKVRATLEALAKSELDGVICVSMLGEGFNFPRLKIAAIHSPHRSLEVTLQFIGRFARTNTEMIGPAKFVGITNEMEIEGARLFEEGAVWQEIITNLGHERVEEERDIRERLEEFEEVDEQDPDLQDLSLAALYPRCHVKIYDTVEKVDLSDDFDFSDEFNVLYRHAHPAGHTLVLIARERARPKWSSSDKIVDSRHDLIVLHADHARNLLFINASRNLVAGYDSIAAIVSPDARSLPTNIIRRVIRGINNQRIFNIGMRNIQASNTTESYRIIAGSSTGPAVKPADSRLFRQGHAFLSGEDEDGRVTIGYSSGSKVWASANEQIPRLIDWCTGIGEKIRTAGAVVTNSGLDYLSAGEVTEHVPDDIIHVQWHRDAFEFDPPTLIEYRKADGSVARVHIMDAELSIGARGANKLTIELRADGLAHQVAVSLSDETDADGFYRAKEGFGQVSVVKGNTAVDLVDYLNEYYLDFFTAGGALFSGNEIYVPSERCEAIDESQIETWDWQGVNIRAEVAGSAAGSSVHERVREVLLASDAEIVLYDHGSGEIADFVTFRRADDAIRVSYYHCKGSAEPKAGARVADVYEVCSQAQKSVALAGMRRLQARVLERKAHTEYARGTREELATLFTEAKGLRARFEVVVVQPGISREALSEGMKEPMGATDEHLRSAGCAPLRVIASA